MPKLPRQEREAWLKISLPDSLALNLEALHRRKELRFLLGDPQVWRLTKLLMGLPELLGVRDLALAAIPKDPGPANPKGSYVEVPAAEEPRSSQVPAFPACHPHASRCRKLAPALPPCPAMLRFQLRHLPVQLGA